MVDDGEEFGAGGGVVAEEAAHGRGDFHHLLLGRTHTCLRAPVLLKQILLYLLYRSCKLSIPS